MRRKTYYRVHNGILETQGFNSRRKAHEGGWSTNQTVAKRRAMVVPPDAEEAAEDKLATLLEFTRDELRAKAAAAEIAGRGSMNKQGLAEALCAL